MKPEQIFIGNIRKCTMYEDTTVKCNSYFGNTLISCDTFGQIKTKSKLYKSNAILIKLKCGGYVDIDNLNNILDYLKIHKDIKKNGYYLGGMIMTDEAHNKDCLFVEYKSLRPYYQHPETEKNISVKKIKKEIKRK